MPSKSGIENINHALVAKPHTPMYLMHKYWARKPHNVVSEYIKHYSKKGDIILDPFCGSGPTPIEAIKIERKAVGVDLNPIGTLITRMTAMPIDRSRIESTFKEIQRNCESEIGELFETNCIYCKDRAIVLATINRKKKYDPIEIRYFCNRCNNRYAKEPDQKDLQLLRGIDSKKIPFWYPATKLAYNGRDFKEGTHDPDIDSIDKLFSKRNLIALSILFNHIDNINDSRIRDIFKFSFTSMVHLASKMCPVAKPSERSHWSEYSSTSFWAVHRFWIPPISMESNVWMLFESAIKGAQGIIRGKEDSESKITYYKEAKVFDDLGNDANIFLKTHSALELTDIIPENSIDYVFTDPPYGGSVQYFELSTLWASWLKLELNYKDEVTINKQQNKDFNFYHQMLTASFRQVYDVLKMGKYMTVTFHSTDVKVWTSIIKAVMLAGFDLEKIVYQPPARASAKGLLQPFGSAVGDYYIRFRKPTGKSIKSTEDVNEERYERIIVGAAKTIIAERGEPTIYQYILNGIIVELKKEGALLSGKIKPENIMKNHLNKEFTLIDVRDETGKKIGIKWWLKNPSDIPYLERVSLSDRVETAIVDVLRRKVKISFDNILQDIFIKFPNALTPETQNVRNILSEYADKTKDGKWMLKNIVKARESEHNSIIFKLGTIGKKLGYDIFIGIREQAEVYDGKRLATLCTQKSPNFRFIPTIDLDRVKQIDVLWYEDGRVLYAFEVENTTAITEAILRGSHIPSGKVKRFIIIPEERENLLFRKLNEPLLMESVEKDSWQFMFYKDIEEYFEKTRRKKKLEIKDIENLARSPKQRDTKQFTLEI